MVSVPSKSLEWLRFLCSANFSQTSKLRNVSLDLTQELLILTRLHCFNSTNSPPAFNSLVMSTNYSQASFNQSMTNEYQLLFGFSLGLLSIGVTLAGILGNGLALAVFRHRAMRKAPVNVLLAGLAVVDISVLLFGGTVFPANAINTYTKIREHQTFVSYLVAYVYPLAMMSQTASIWLLLLITIERTIAVFLPLHARDLCTRTRTRNALILVIIVACLYNIVRFWEYELVPETDDYGGVYAQHRLGKDPNYVSIYVLWLYFFSHFLIPFLALLTFNGLIVLKIRQSRNERTTLTRTESTEHKTATMLFFIVIVFLLFNILAMCLNCMEALGWNKDSLFFALIDISNVLILLGSASNILIYYKFSKNFRVVLQKLISFELRGTHVRLLAIHRSSSAAFTPIQRTTKQTTQSTQIS